jgi:hypothetical protein
MYEAETVDVPKDKVRVCSKRDASEFIPSVERLGLEIIRGVSVRKKTAV